MQRAKTAAIMAIVLLFGTGASLTKSLRLERSADGVKGKDGDMTVATGVPFYVLAKKGLSVNPLEFVESGAVVIEHAAVDAPRLFQVESWGNSAVLVRGLAPGETTLHVTGRVGKQKQGASIGIRTAAPTSASLVQICGSSAWAGGLVGVGEVLVLEERLLNGATVLMSDRYPEVDFGTFTPAPNIGQKLKPSGKAGELIGPVHLEARAPAKPGPATLRIPEFGFALPLRVFDASEVNGVQILDPGRIREGGKTSVSIRFLVDGILTCTTPAVPVEITIGPASVCVLANETLFRRLPDTRPNYRIYEAVIAPQALAINANHAGSDCEVTATVKGSGKMAAAKFAITAKPPDPAHGSSHGSGHGGGGHHGHHHH
jgi:hypothetical protein